LRVPGAAGIARDDGGLLKPLRIEAAARPGDPSQGASENIDL